MMTEEELRSELELLDSAEEFLDYFELDYDLRVVQINRLHILQRFHDLLDSVPVAADPVAHYRQRLAEAYAVFVNSSAQEQKVLKVFQQPAPGFVSVDEL